MEMNKKIKTELAYLNVKDIKLIDSNTNYFVNKWEGKITVDHPTGKKLHYDVYIEEFKDGNVVIDSLYRHTSISFNIND